MASLETSFRNQRNIKTGSITQVGSSNSSPRQNKQPPKPTPNPKSKSIERANKPALTLKKANGTQTPIRLTTTSSKGNLSPVSASTSKSYTYKRDMEGELNKRLESNKKSPTKTPNKSPMRSAVMSVRTSISGLPINAEALELPGGISDKLENSMEMGEKSISEFDLPENKEDMTDRSSCRKSSDARPIDSELNILSSKSGQVSKKNNISNTFLIMQNVYAIKAKPISLTSTLRSVSRSRNQDETASKNKKGVTGNTVGLKETDLKHFQDMKQNYEAAKGIALKKTSSEPANKEQELEVRKICSNGGWSIITSLIPTTETMSSQEQLNIKEPILQANSAVRGVYSGSVYSSMEKNTRISKTASPNSRASPVRPSEKSDDMPLLRQQLNLFIGKLEGTVGKLALKEKRNFFMKLLQMLRKQKILLSKFLKSQEYMKMSLCFYMWQDYAKIRKEARINGGIEITKISDDEVNLQAAIDFHNRKTYSKYFYQGFLGYYAMCKLGNHREDSPPATRKGSPISVRKQTPTLNTLQPMRKTILETELTSPIRSKTPSQIRSRETPKQPNEPTKDDFVRRATPVARGPNDNSSPNQSFLADFEKSYKKDRSIMQKSAIKTPQRIRPPANNTNLNKSFGQKSSKPAVEKRGSVGKMRGGMNVWQANKSVCDEDDINLNRGVKTPQPAKKRELFNFETQGPMTLDSNRVREPEKVRKVESQMSVRSRGENVGLNKSINAGGNQDRKRLELEKKISESKDIVKVAKKKTEQKKDAASLGEIKTTRTNSCIIINNDKNRGPLSKKSSIVKADVEGVFEQAREEANLKKALGFRNKKLLRKYGKKFISILSKLVKEKSEAAWCLRIKNLLKHGFMGLCGQGKVPQGGLEQIVSETESGTSEGLEEEKDDEKTLKKMELAKEHYKMNMKMNVFNAFLEHFINCYEENNLYAQHRERNLLKTCFSKWCDVRPELREEKIEEESEEEESPYEGIVEQFRFIVLAEKVLKQLKSNVANANRSKIVKKKAK